jgi:hypothetical protein
VANRTLAARPPLNRTQREVYEAWIALSFSLARAERLVDEIVSGDIEGDFREVPDPLPEGTAEGDYLELYDGQEEDIRSMRYQLGHFQAVLASTTPRWMQAEIDRRLARQRRRSRPAGPAGLRPYP